MLNLMNSNTDKLQLITSAACTIDVAAFWADLSGTTVTPGRSLTPITTATTTDIVATPASSTNRNVRSILIRNKGSASVDVTVVLDNNSTDYELHKATLLVGDTLQWTEGTGFFTITPSAKLNLMLRTAGDQAFSTAATLADITGLTCAVKSGKFYSFIVNLFHISGATTTGAQFGVNCSVAATLVIVANWSGVTNGAAGSVVFSLAAQTALNTVITAQTTGSSANTHTYLAGHIIPSADGTFAVRATAEVAATMTVKQGSNLFMRECDN